MAQIETLHEYNLGIIPDELSRNHGKTVTVAGLSAQIWPWHPSACQECYLLDHSVQ